MTGSQAVGTPKPVPANETWPGEHVKPAGSRRTPLAAAVWLPEQVCGLGEREIARIADVHRGFALREQLLAAGLGRGAIVHRLNTGRLREWYRGVYLVDRLRPGPLGEEMAAVLRFRGYAILSHRTAAWLWGLVEQRPTRVSVTLAGKNVRSSSRLNIHRVRDVDSSDVCAHRGLPVSSPARAVVDFAGEASADELEDAISIAIMRDLVLVEEIQSAMSRAPRRKGVARLRRLLDRGGTEGFSRARSERRLRSILRAAELPQPIANVPMLGHVADFLWPEFKLIVEVDGYGFHGNHAAFESDRRRDQQFAAAGYLVVRITWPQLRDEPFAVVARLAQVLVSRAA